MEFTEHEQSIMKVLAEAETFALLTKIFVDMPTANLAELDKNIVALSDAQYGQLMKVKYLREKDNKSRLEFIIKATKTRTTNSSGAIAPK